MQNKKIKPTEQLKLFLRIKNNKGSRSVCLYNARIFIYLESQNIDRTDDEVKALMKFEISQEEFNYHNNGIFLYHPLLISIVGGIFLLVAIIVFVSTKTRVLRISTTLVTNFTFVCCSLVMVYMGSRITTKFHALVYLVSLKYNYPPDRYQYLALRQGFKIFSILVSTGAFLSILASLSGVFAWGVTTMVHEFNQKWSHGNFSFCE